MSTAPILSGGAAREAAIRAGVITGGIDTVITLGAMVAANSAVLLADFFKTFLEFLAVLLSWMAIRRINRGGGATYEYGLGKLENLGSLLVGVLMTVCLLIITGNAVRNMLHPSHIRGLGVWISMGSQVLYSVINGRLGLRGWRMAKAEASPLMASQARLLLTRAVANVFILASLVLSVALSRFHWAQYIDPLSSLVIAASILMAALGIFSSSVSDLLDRTLEESDQLVILRELARYFDEYEALHGIRSRRSGTDVYIDILLEFNAERKMGEIHEVAEQMRRRIEEQIRGSRVTIGLARTGTPAP
ncbi:MAG TPA: cation diffusion facilitator family transporter [Kiritimatiellia bacterium]|nr:cation diffusion facilitator family transporter [Kiritimatiellia bacterium]HRZ13496.1 cation diffusion facilitator family transporter [Kiritimatiellia bacterium]HSA19199.1 cation diffusion facilitator family transporter [Kiritimatiellia bacterium]